MGCGVGLRPMYRGWEERGGAQLPTISLDALALQVRRLPEVILEPEGGASLCSSSMFPSPCLLFPLHPLLAAQAGIETETIRRALKELTAPPAEEDEQDVDS